MRLVIQGSLIATLCAFAASSAAQVTSFGASCPTTTGVTPALDLPSSMYAGATVGLHMSGPPGALGFLIAGPSDSTWLGIPLPLDLALVTGGAFAGKLLVSPIVTVTPALDASGEAEAFFVVGSAGQTLFLQLLVSDPASGMLIGASSLGWKAITQSSPTITGASPATAAVDTLVDVSGMDFPTDPTDICVQAKNAMGETSALLLPVSSDGSTLTAVVTAIAPGETEAFVTVMTGKSKFADPSIAPPGITFGPKDVRIWTSDGTPGTQATTPITLTPPLPPPANTSGCEEYTGCLEGSNIEITIPFTETCPVGAMFRLQVDACAVNTVFCGGAGNTASFDYAATYTNTAVLSPAECAIAACVVFQTAFLTEECAFVPCNVSVDGDGNATIVISPPLTDAWKPGAKAVMTICR